MSRDILNPVDTDVFGDLVVDVSTGSAGDVIGINGLPVTALLASQRGAANGVASLDSNGKLFLTQANLVNNQTLASNGAVTIDARTGKLQRITLQANATSSSITNATTGQELTIQWIEDATGGRTYVWPTNCKFAGGSAPSGTTASKLNSVTFYYDGTNWQESARAATVG